MFLWTVLFLIGSCAADDGFSDVHVDTSVNATGSVSPPVDSIHSPSLTYTLTVYFANVSAGSALKITMTTLLNDTCVTVIHPIDGTDLYSTSHSLTVFAAGPTATVQVVLTRPDLTTKFGAVVNWSLPSIAPLWTHSAAVTVDRPSYIAYQGYMGSIAQGGVVVSRPPGADLCISRPETPHAFQSTMFVYSGDSVTNNVYVGRLDKLMGCAGDRETSLPDTVTIVAPDSVALVDTPVFTLKSALTSYSLASFTPKLLNDGARTVSIDHTPQTFLHSQPFRNTSFIITLSEFFFLDSDSSVQVWCGALYDNSSAQKYMIAEISKTSLDSFAYGGRFRAFCRSLTLKTSKGTVSVRVQSDIPASIIPERVVAPGSRGVITNFNYPFPDITYFSYMRPVITDDKMLGEISFSLRFTELATTTQVNSFNTDVAKNQHIPSVQPGEWLTMSGYAVTMDPKGPGVHYRMEYRVDGMPTAATPTTTQASTAGLGMALLAAVLLI